MEFKEPTRKGERWTAYELEDLKNSYRAWLIKNAKKHGRTPKALEIKLGLKNPYEDEYGDF